MQNKCYTFYDKLGFGTYGEVWRVKAPDSQIIAIKLVDLEGTVELSPVLSELHSLKEVQSEYVTRCLGAEVVRSQLWIMMEYCQAGSCLSMIKRWGAFKEDTAYFVLRSTLKGLEYIHRLGMIHRDIKASNVLVTANCEVKLADFGVAAKLSDTMPARESLVGTPYWMAPEVIHALPYHSPVDIWSVGILGWELVTGVPPHSAMKVTQALFRIANGDAPNLKRDARAKQSWLSRAYCDLVNSCLQRSPAARPTASALLLNRHLSKGKVPPSLKALVAKQLSRHEQVTKQSRHMPMIINPAAEAHNSAQRYDGDFFDDPPAEFWNFDVSASNPPQSSSALTSPDLDIGLSSPASTGVSPTAGPPALGEPSSVLNIYQDAGNNRHSKMLRRSSAGYSANAGPSPLSEVTADNIAGDQDKSGKDSHPERMVSRQAVVPAEPIAGVSKSGVFNSFFLPTLQALYRRAATDDAKREVRGMIERLARANDNSPGLFDAFKEELLASVVALGRRCHG